MPTKLSGSDDSDSAASRQTCDQQFLQQLQRRLRDAVREQRNAEEYARQVMLELLRVRELQQAAEQRADAAEVESSSAKRQQEELRAELRRIESTCLEMEQTPGWWLIKSFHGWMKRSPRLAGTIGVAVRAARTLRLLPAGRIEEARRIAPLVDEKYYFRTYPETKAWGVPAAEHYLRLGASKGYNPSAAFDTRFYLAQYPDVAAAGVNPLMHFVEVGAGEGRRTQADPQAAPADSTIAAPALPAPLGAASDTAAPASIQLPDRSALRPHRELVSIIVTVHNALEYVRACLNSILLYTFPPYELILVDDGSELATCEYLRGFAAQHGAVLLRSESASGYTLAANRGLRAARGDYVLLLNSDTIVTENWLDRMVACAESDPHIGIVGPLSNRANWQSIPEVVRDGEWADNELPENWTIQEMAQAVAAFTGRTYPQIPFLNGFCLLIKRRVLESVGYFDEVNFGRGYGEENDYCLRTRAQGWLLSIADDAYVYHVRTRSYSIESRDKLSEVGHRMLYTKHKKAVVDQGVEQARANLVLLGIRVRASQMCARQSLIEEGRKRWKGKRIAFVLPIRNQSELGDVTLTEAKAIERFGASVLIINLNANKQTFRAAYPELELQASFVPGAADVPDAVRACDAVVATTCESVSAVQELDRAGRTPILAHYIQDYEPSFLPPESAEHRSAFSSYNLIPNLIRFTRTASSRDELLRRVCVESKVVGLSCDIDLFRPRVVLSSGKLNLSAIVRSSWPESAIRETMEVLAQVDRCYGDRVAIHVFGVDSCDRLMCDLSRGVRLTNHGLRTREQIAALLSAQDIFVDLFHQQAMGQTAMEAMASGAAVVLPQAGASGREFAVHGENALVVDPSNRTACLEAVGALVENRELLDKLRRRALCDVVRFWPEQAAFNLMDTLFFEEKPARNALPTVSHLTAQV